jgi:stage V sporulation protein SpoVS
MLWTDVAAGLVAYTLPPGRRLEWTRIEAEVAGGLAGPVRDEGPAFVRAWGATARIRLVFGLEELREKVVLAAAGIDDAVVEVLKDPWVDHAEVTGPVVDRAGPGGLYLVWPPPVEQIGAVPEPVAVIGWDEYEAATARRSELLTDRPGLTDGTWVHWVRGQFGPCVITAS